MWHYSGMTTDSPAYRATPWAAWLFRVTITVEAILALGQPILIGAFLQGNYDALAAHQTNATITGITAMVTAVAAVLYWRAGHGPAWPTWLSLLLVAAIVVQIVVGYSRILAVHIPLGVLIVTTALWLAVWSWRSS